MYRVAILVCERFRIPLQSVRKFYVSKCFGQPCGCPEVNQIENEVKAKFPRVTQPLVAPRPVELAARWFNNLPRQGIPHPFAAQLMSSPLEIIFPEYVVLSPLKLV